MKTLFTLLFAFLTTFVSAQTYNIISVPPVKITVNQDHSITYVQEGLTFANPISGISLNYAYGTAAGAPSQFKVVANLTSSSIVGGVLTYTTSACELLDSAQFAANCVITFIDPFDYANGGCSTVFWRRPGVTFQGMGYPQIGCAGGITGTDLPFTGCSPTPAPAPANDCFCPNGKYKVTQGASFRCATKANCLKWVNQGWTSSCGCQ